MDILFICLGNICRSPAAEGIMKAKLRERFRDGEHNIDSAGIGSWHVGELPDLRMRQHAGRRGYDLISRARQFRDTDFVRFDRIVVMDEENYREISARARNGEERGKVLRMCDYFVKFKGRLSVPDPYYGEDSDFELALDLIEDGCEGLLSHLFEDE